MANEAEKTLHEMQQVLTIDANGAYETEEDKAELLWHELQNVCRSKRILSGVLSGVEETSSGSIAVVYYKGQRMIIPVSEMELNLSEQNGYGEMKGRQVRILNNMVGCEIDFILIALDDTARSVVASRRLAMLAKRRKFYFPNENGNAQITEGRVVQARVIAVAEKVVRLEVFGAECAVPARDIAWEWVGDAREKYHVGDRVMAVVTSVESDAETMNVKITADMKRLMKNEVLEKLKECKVQGRYSGRITDIHKGVIFVRLSNGVNAIAHSCNDYRLPGKNDDISFVVNRLDQENGVAVGIITRIIRQNI